MGKGKSGDSKGRERERQEGGTCGNLCKIMKTPMIRDISTVLMVLCPPRNSQVFRNAQFNAENRNSFPLERNLRAMRSTQGRAHAPSDLCTSWAGTSRRYSACLFDLPWRISPTPYLPTRLGAAHDRGSAWQRREEIKKAKTAMAQIRTTSEAPAQESGQVQQDANVISARRKISRVSHETTVIFSEHCIGRPYGIRCSCGFSSAAVNEKEAERVAENHKRQTGK